MSDDARLHVERGYSEGLTYCPCGQEVETPEGLCLACFEKERARFDRGDSLEALFVTGVLDHALRALDLFALDLPVDPRNPDRTTEIRRGEDGEIAYRLTSFAGPRRDVCHLAQIRKVLDDELAARGVGSSLVEILVVFAKDSHARAPISQVCPTSSPAPRPPRPPSPREVRDGEW